MALSSFDAAPLHTQVCTSCPWYVRYPTYEAP
jgi:hypothetical protein